MLIRDGVLIPQRPVWLEVFVQTKKKQQIALTLLI